MVKKIIIVANWKCNPTTFEEAKRLFDVTRSEIKKTENIEIVICPPFIFLPIAKSYEFSAKFGAQDVFWENRGAYTGEISPAMLKDLGCEYVIIGHSERRNNLGETNQMVNKKLKAALKNHLKPILCVGENQDERTKGEAEKVIKEQLETALFSIKASLLEISNFSIAYEPVWAIGSDATPSFDETMTMQIFIRQVMRKLFSKEARVSNGVNILYGGSVNSKNCADFIFETGMQGLLIGGASLNLSEFGRIVKRIKELTDY